MTSSRLALALIVTGACSNEVPTLDVTATAQTQVTVAPPGDPVPIDRGHYRWELVDAPPTSDLLPPPDQTAMIAIRPPRRGVYAYERWFVGEAAQELSYFVIVTVGGAPPIPVVTGPTDAAIGELVRFDGTQSTSPEARSLSYEWRLATRPEASAAELDAATNLSAAVVPDVGGTYTIEPRVFDGELWSAPVSAMLLAR